MRVVGFPQRLIHELNIRVNPAFVEAFMRLEYHGLCHLPRETFETESAGWRQEQDLWPPALIESTCASYGLLAEYQAWEQAYSAESGTYQLPRGYQLPR